MDELIKEKPHEVYFRLHLPAWETAIPKDREWRSLNFVARRSSEETVAKFCSEAYAMQQQEGRGAHLEVNSTSAIWATDIFADVVGYEVRVDLCRFGQQVRSQNGRFMGYSNSSVRVRSASRRLVEEVGLRCLCSKPHAAVSAVAVRGPAVKHGEGHC